MQHWWAKETSFKHSKFQTVNCDWIIDLFSELDSLIHWTVQIKRTIPSQISHCYNKSFKTSLQKSYGHHMETFMVHRKKNDVETIFIQKLLVNLINYYIKW